MTELLRLTVFLMTLAPMMATVMVAIMAKRIGISAAEAISIVLSSIMAWMALLLAYQVFGLSAPEALAVNYAWLGAESSVGLWIDRLSASSALLVTQISWWVQLYTVFYLRKDSTLPRFLTCLQFMSASLLFAVLSHSMLGLFMAWVMMTWAAYGLLNFWYERDAAVLAASLAMIGHAAGDLALLASIMLTGSQHSGSAWALLLAVMIKSGFIPFHHRFFAMLEAPTPAVVLLHVLVPMSCAWFVLQRYSGMFDHAWLHDTFLLLGSFQAFWGIWRALLQHDFKRMLGGLMCSQWGFLLAHAGMSSDIFWHGVSLVLLQSSLLLTCGQCLRWMHPDRDLAGMRGMARQLPWVVLLLCIIAGLCIGLPPGTGFWDLTLWIESVRGDVSGVSQAAGILLFLAQAGTMAFWMRLMIVWSTQKSRHRALSAAPFLLVLPTVMLLLAAMSLEFYFHPGRWSAAMAWWMQAPTHSSLWAWGLGAWLGLWEIPSMPRMAWPKWIDERRPRWPGRFKWSLPETESWFFLAFAVMLLWGLMS